MTIITIKCQNCEKENRCDVSKGAGVFKCGNCKQNIHAVAQRDNQILGAALEQLRLRLLDLTGRNRLLNFKHTIGKSLQFVEGQPSAIYQKLIEGNNKPSIKILGIPEPASPDWVERNGRLSRPEAKDWAREQGISTSYELPLPESEKEQSNVRALLYPDDLAKHCRKIEREANLAIEETGANMLFLVLGFLEYPDQKDSDRVFAAPLISVPVTMSKQASGGNQNFSLQYTGDDVSENLSLRTKLEIDHGLILPEFDEDQIDVEAYFSAISAIIQKRPNFVLRRKVSLCLLSFSNMLLVRDLDPEKWPMVGDQHGLLDHPIIQEVFGGNGVGGGGGADVAVEHPVEDGPSANIPLVYDADSSQHSALVDVLSEKRNLVIEGPPGTGKSQTITNLIAACLAGGKKVLFVAEKLAALEVVKNRLSLAGLDPFVLELHSNKTNKKRVLEELAKRLGYISSTPNNFHRILQQVETNRNELKSYSDIINSITHNQFGFTLHQVVWSAEKHRSKLSVEETVLIDVPVSDATELSGLELSRRVSCLKHLSSQYEVVGGFDSDSVFWGFLPERILPGDESKLKNLFTSLLEWSRNFISNVTAYNELLNCRAFGFSLGYVSSQLEMLKSLLENADERLPLHLLEKMKGMGRDQSKKVLEKLAVQILRYSALESIMREGLKDGADASQDRLLALRQLDRLVTTLGVNVSGSEGFERLLNLLQSESGKLRIAHEAVDSFCSTKNIPYDAARDKFEKFALFAKLVDEIPDEYFHLQTQGLARDGCVPALELALKLQNELGVMQGELDEALYIDALPNEEAIRQAILTLREGNAWYRIFQGRWRSAITLHKRLQRTKKPIPFQERLVQLEKLTAFIKLKQQWETIPVFKDYLGPQTVESPVQLGDYLKLARWNQTAQLLLEELQSQAFSPVELTPERARALRREFSDFRLNISKIVSSIEVIDQLLPKLAGMTNGHNVGGVLENVNSLMRAISEQLDWFYKFLPVESNLSRCIVACDAAIERQNISKDIAGNVEARELLVDQFLGVETDVSGALAVLTFGQRIDDLDLNLSIKEMLFSDSPLGTCRSIIMSIEAVVKDLKQVTSLEETLNNIGSFNVSVWVASDLDGDLLRFAECLNRKLQDAATNIDSLIPWFIYVTNRKDAAELGLGDFVSLIENKKVCSNELSDAYAYCVYSTIIREATRSTAQLSRFSGLKHNQIRDEFRRIDKEIIRLRGQAIAADCHRIARPPSGRSGMRVNDKTEMVLLNYLLPQQRPRMPVRKMLSRAGAAIQSLKPCFMMGPQAVAQYLTPGHIKFDLVIMDEASQLKPEEAIGAIARGGQLVVVGDSKQLPPTSFFSRMSQAVEEDEQFSATDAESILDVCSSHFRPPRVLRWHYRSQHHSLIAFSNRHFYRDNLIIFPSPYGQSSKLGVRAIYLKDAIYDNQTNLKEARRVVDAVVEHVINKPNESLGVVTLNVKQRDLIAELMDERLRTLPEADDYREKWTTDGQPLFIKNLENVQGDERDAIIISTTFGKSPGSSVVRQNFGPISRMGGWRRLNVLFTRAKKSIAIYTSIRPEDIVLDGSTPEGTKALRNYLEYARTGSLVTAEETCREPDSDFEVAVMDVLHKRGYEVTPQLGVAGYRIDIAVKHPDSAGTYLAAIECDGASYHSALSVRDRDRIRQEVLESMGWRGRIWRIWSTDWFQSPKQEIEKLVSYLEDLRKTWKPEHSSGSSWIEEGDSSITITPSTISSERSVVDETLLGLDDYVEVKVGDLVKYADVNKLGEILQVQITAKTTDIPNGLVSEATPLAQVLLGSVAGDEVTLNIPGVRERTFRILEIKVGSEEKMEASIT